MLYDWVMRIWPGVGDGETALTVAVFEVEMGTRRAGGLEGHLLRPLLETVFAVQEALPAIHLGMGPTLFDVR